MILSVGERGQSRQGTITLKIKYRVTKMEGRAPASPACWKIQGRQKGSNGSRYGNSTHSGAPWMRGEFKGRRSKGKSFFASIFRMFRINPVFLISNAKFGFKLSSYQAIRLVFIILYPVNRCKIPLPSPMPLQNGSSPCIEIHR